MKDAQQEINDAMTSMQRHVNLCRKITKCPADETLAVWLKGMIRLDDPVVTGLVEALKEHSNSMARFNALSAYEARVKEVEK